MTSQSSFDLAAGIPQTPLPWPMANRGGWASKEDIRAMLYEITPKRYPLNYPDTKFPEHVALTPPLPEGSLEGALRGEEIPELNLNFPHLTDDVSQETLAPSQQERPTPKRRRREAPNIETLRPEILVANQLLDTPVFEPSRDLHLRERLRRSLSTPAATPKQGPGFRTPVLDFRRELEKYHADWAATHEPPRPPVHERGDWHATNVDAIGSMGYYDPGAEATLHTDPNPALRDWRGAEAEAESVAMPPVWYNVDASHGRVGRCPPSVRTSPPRCAGQMSRESLDRGGADSPDAFAIGSPALSSKAAKSSTGATSVDETWPLTLEADCALRWAERTRKVRGEVESRQRR